MATIKQERLNQIILREVTDIIQFSVKDPSVGFVTITDVDVSNDHSYATVYVTFLGKKERNEKGIKTLSKAKGYIRSELSKRLKTRRVPEINFKLDESYEKARKLDAILQQINSEKKEEE